LCREASGEIEFDEQDFSPNERNRGGKEVIRIELDGKKQKFPGTPAPTKRKWGGGRNNQNC